MLFDALVWLAVAKFVVLLLEDASYAVRGKQSPRRQERARRQAAQAAGEAAGKPAPAGGGWERTRAAVGGYIAGLAEDATASARARRRRAAARKRGGQAVDGVFVDVDADGGFYADCDVCGWSSRRYRLESNARAAGAQHTRNEHPELLGETKEDSDTNNADSTDEADVATRPKLRVIPGGQPDQAADPKPASPATPDPQPQSEPATASHEPSSSVVHDDHSSDNTTTTTRTDTKENTVNLEATGPEEIRSAFQTAIDTANERAEEIAGIAAVLGEAADRYESLEMAGSTVGHLRDASEAVAAAQAALNTAVEELQAALADFNAKDGAVANVVADTGGNVASKEVLVG